MKTKKFKFIRLIIDSLFKCFNNIIFSFFSIFSIFTLIISTTLFAQWSTDPYNNLIVGYGLLPELASDSTGGCYITYEQNTGYPRLLNLERLNKYGYKPWGTGKRILGELPEQSNARIVEDGQRGVIITYQDNYWGGMSGPWISRLRVQRVDSSGNFLWGPTGVRVSLSETNQGDQAIVSDGAGGCIVAWKDTLNQIRLQRISSIGTRIWEDGGLFLSVSSEKVLLSWSNLVGAITLYYEDRQFKVQRVNHLGNFLWGSGIRIPTGARVMKFDNQNNVYFFGGKSIGIRNGQALFTLNLQKADTTSNLLWDSLGVTLDTLNTNYYLNYDFSTQSGYSTISWPQNTGSVWDLRTQIVRSDGSTVFPYGGIPISRTSSKKGIVGVLPSDSMTSLFVWTDNRTPLGVYIQRLDTLGIPCLDSNDVLFCDISLGGGLKLTTDGIGGCIAAGWRETDFTVRAQQVNKYGQLGQDITSVENVNNQFPQKFLLHQNYPNPFNSSTSIKFTVTQRSNFGLIIYDLLGKQIKTFDLYNYSPGSYQVIWDGTDILGNQVPSGVYYYNLFSPLGTQTKKNDIIEIKLKN